MATSPSGGTHPTSGEKSPPRPPRSREIDPVGWNSVFARGPCAQSGEAHGRPQDRRAGCGRL